MEYLGKCAKSEVKCTIISVNNEVFVGKNWCENPQDICPRKKGEGYDKCTSVCGQYGHAEINALSLAGKKAKGGKVFLEGHTHACKDCQEALYGAGIESISLNKPNIPTSKVESVRNAIADQTGWD